MILLDGKKVSTEIITNVKKELENINEKIKFAIIWIGEDEGSRIYINNKIKKCAEVGIEGLLYHLDENVSEDEVINLVNELNAKKEIKGIIIQSPVPKHINYLKCCNLIDYKKDIDGFSNISVGNLCLGNPYHISCTPEGIIKLLEYYHIPIAGQNVCIINRSNIVGKPLFHLLIDRDATVVMCHSKTKNLKEITKEADILISAVGKPKFITEDMVKENAVVIDVGISRVDGHVTGDVDFPNVSKKVSYITPVPGGVGPMTVAMIFENILKSVKEDHNG